jgi:hypothetical protein
LELDTQPRVIEVGVLEVTESVGGNASIGCVESVTTDDTGLFTSVFLVTRKWYAVLDSKPLRVSDVVVETTFTDANVVSDAFLYSSSYPVRPASPLSPATHERLTEDTVLEATESVGAEAIIGSVESVTTDDTGLFRSVILVTRKWYAVLDSKPLRVSDVVVETTFTDANVVSDAFLYSSSYPVRPASPLELDTQPRVIEVGVLEVTESVGGNASIGCVESVTTDDTGLFMSVFLVTRKSYDVLDSKPSRVWDGETTATDMNPVSDVFLYSSSYPVTDASPLELDTHERLTEDTVLEATESVGGDASGLCCGTPLPS